jgi:hypothetical protein
VIWSKIVVHDQLDFSHLQMRVVGGDVHDEL